VDLGGDFKLIGLSFYVWIKVHLSDLMPEFRTIAMFQCIKKDFTRNL